MYRINRYMINSKIVIFGWPRSGTKLLANVLEQQGYLNLGEFFETFATELKDGSHVTAIRLPREDQFAMFRAFHANMHEETHKHSILLSDRITLFQRIRVPARTTLTVFGSNVDMAPELIDILSTRYFLCTRRRNILEQILSMSLTYYYKNYNAEGASSPMIVNLNQLDRLFFAMKKTERLQNYLVSIGRGIIVDFDELITGTLDLGFTYEVTTSDQHENLSGLIINYEDVLHRFNYLTSVYD